MCQLARVWKQVTRSRKKQAAAFGARRPESARVTWSMRPTSSHTAQLFSCPGSQATSGISMRSSALCRRPPQRKTPRTLCVRGVDRLSAYRRYFVQGNVGAPFRTSLLKLWGEGGASLRVAHVRFTTLRVGENAPYDGTARTFVEPSFFVRFGHPIFVCEAQLGCSLTLPTRPMLDYRSLYMSLGFHARFGGGEPLP